MRAIILSLGQLLDVNDNRAIGNLFSLIIPKKPGISGLELKILQGKIINAVIALRQQFNQGNIKTWEDYFNLLIEKVDELRDLYQQDPTLMDAMKVSFNSMVQIPANLHDMLNHLRSLPDTMVFLYCETNAVHFEHMQHEGIHFSDEQTLLPKIAGTPVYFSFKLGELRLDLLQTVVNEIRRNSEEAISAERKIDDILIIYADPNDINDVNLKKVAIEEFINLDNLSKELGFQYVKKSKAQTFDDVLAPKAEVSEQVAQLNI